MGEPPRRASDAPTGHLERVRRGSRLSTDLFASSGFAPEASRSKRHLGQTLNSGRAGGSIDVSAYAVPYPYTPMYQDYATVPTAGRFPGTIPLPPGHYAGGTYAGTPNMYHWPYAEYDRRPGHVDVHPRSAAVPLGYIPAGAYANGSGNYGAPSTELDNHAYGYSNGACAPLLLHPAEGRAIVSAFPGRGWYHPASPPSPSPPPPQSLQRLPEAISLATLPPRPGTPSKETTGELSRACGYSEVKKYQNNHPNHSLALKQQRVLWTHEEDQQLTELVHHFGPQRWQAMASQFMPHRAGAQLRSRWIYVLDQRDRRRPFSEEEDRLILQLYEEHGRRWNWISRHLNDRTDQEVKSRYHQLSRVRAETEGGSKGKGTESVSDRSARSPKSETVGRLPCPNSNVSALTQLDSRKALHGAAGQSERKEEQPRSSRANSVENSSGHHDATT
ncbi:Transcriptional activator Myb [Porphyridium purpureum]|uniref:Transcriptional activator Myb n=1 Tax=Porphyridium purpureum TaxID=35688 RepID=A0A5J4Z8V4_PORPP|nr:Transcriptional activator Myb [Porphyridium purpureum]|eukprot:POR5857..scf295_1